MNNTDITYDKLQNHLLKECLQIPVVCKIGGCNTSFARSEWLSHFNKCEKLTVSCPQCGLAGIPRPVMAQNQHNCIKALQEMVGQHAKMIEAQQNQIREMKQQMDLILAKVNTNDVRQLPKG
jgi:hypothetical protein